MTINLDLFDAINDLCEYIDQADASDPVVIAARDMGRITHRDIEISISFHDGKAHADAEPKGKLLALLDVRADAQIGGEGPISVREGAGTDVGA